MVLDWSDATKSDFIRHYLQNHILRRYTAVDVDIAPLLQTKVYFKVNFLLRSKSLGRLSGSCNIGIILLHSVEQSKSWYTEINPVQ